MSRDVLPLSGKTILVVEDEFFIALDIATELEAMGARVSGPVSNIDDAFQRIDGAPSVSLDAAVLDVNVNGSMVYELADKLRQNKIPFVFVTGYECSNLPDRFRACLCLTKPCNERDLIALLAKIDRDHSASGDGKETHTFIRA